MRKRKNFNDFGDVTCKRLLSVSEGCLYTGLGKSTFQKLAEELGAKKKYGKRVLYDRVIIDRAIDTSGEELKGSEA